MDASKTAKQKFQALLREDTRDDTEAYNFMYEALSYSVNHTVQNRIRRKREVVSPKELLEGVRLYAIDQFGLLAKIVLENWGVHTTNDLGNIMVNLVNHDLMNKGKEDNIKDFKDAYKFEDVFDLAIWFGYDIKSDNWKVTYTQKNPSR